MTFAASAMWDQRVSQSYSISVYNVYKIDEDLHVTY